MNMVVSERDQFREETKELLQTKARLVNEALVNNMTSKEKIGRLEIQLKQKNDQNDVHAQTIEKL